MAVASVGQTPVRPRSDPTGTNYTELLLPVYNQAVPVLKRAGKRVRVHYDGDLRALVEPIAAAPFHIIESVSEPPEGDMLLEECPAAWPDKVIWGNINVGLFDLPPPKPTSGRTDVPSNCCWLASPSVRSLTMSGCAAASSRVSVGIVGDVVELGSSVLACRPSDHLPIATAPPERPFAVEIPVQATLVRCPGFVDRLIHGRATCRGATLLSFEKAAG